DLTRTAVAALLRRGGEARGIQQRFERPRRPEERRSDGVREAFTGRSVEVADEERPAGSENPSELGEDRRDVLGRGVDQRVPGEDAAERSILAGQSTKRPMMERQLRVPLARGREELLGEVEAVNLSISVVQERRPLSWPACGTQQGPDSGIAPVCDESTIRGNHLPDVAGDIDVLSSARVVRVRKGGIARTLRSESYAFFGAVPGNRSERSVSLR